MGRPSKYSKELAEKICDELANGKSLVAICQQDEFPCYNTVLNWLRVHEEFLGNYARAREAQADYYAQEIIDLADKERICEKRTIKPDGGEEVVILDQTERTRLQIDARKWYAGKLMPKKYGDKVQQEVSGPNGGPVQASLKVEFVSPK